MCGIAGIVAPAAATLRPNLERMLGAMVHRGPDADGIVSYGNCILGHRRLSIVDLASGSQPMKSEGGQTAVTFNGEIYGFRSMRGQFPYPYRTQSDTELLLAMYAGAGPQMIDRLPGMFSFAIWDESKQRLFAARDRAGEKPFYYAFGKRGEFLFASEIGALIASGLITPELDRESVGEFLALHYVPPNRCIYSNVQSLPPGHALEFANGRVTISRYWNVPSVEDRISLPEAVEEFSSRLRMAVGKQMVADVPVGAFLSGGLDSSTLVALASEHCPGLHTFSFGFGDRIDELPFARSVAERYRTQHHECQDEISDPAATLVGLQRFCDEPVADSAIIPLHLLCRIARQEVTVAIAGEGADELLAGYDFWYRPAYFLDRFRSANWIERRTLRLMAAAMMRAGLRGGYAAGIRQGSALLDGCGTLSRLHDGHTIDFSEEELAGLDLKRSGQTFGKMETDTMEALFARDFMGFLPGDILTKTDRASMAASLEVRCPFLDVDVMTFCLSLPARLKLDGRSDKIVLRRAFEDLWPHATRTRNKQGFGAPVQAWLEWPSFRELVGQILKTRTSKLFDILPFEKVQPYVQQPSYRMWGLLVLGLWAEEWRAA